jgi:hypothetical protein
VLPGAVSRAALRAGMDAQYRRPYARPKGASPLLVPLVPAYAECTSPNDGHGGPLAVGSCTPPEQTSSVLTIGTYSANGVAPNSVGSVVYQVIVDRSSTPTDEADVKMDLSLKDVRRRSDLSDYTGQLQAHTSVRITDMSSGPIQTESATAEDMDFPITASCAETVETTIGATCSISTTLDAVVPGAVVGGKRANWQLGQIQVYDGGASGIAGASDANLFEDAGIYTP